jgi:nickel-dependent lactate racemase
VSVWLLRGRRTCRWDAIRLLGRPPVLSPPAWALTARVWEGIGADSGPLEPSVEPTDFLEEMCAAIPGKTLRIAFVVPDATRVGGWRVLLPRVLEEVRKRCPAAALRLLIASGVHAVVPRAFLLAHLLPGVPNPEKLLEGWTIIQNGENGFRSHRQVGTTPAGTPVRLHPEYLDASWRILLGGISYHYFAGYGGGRKLVFPGLGEPGGIAVNHRRAVRIPAQADPERAMLSEIEWEGRCAPGLLKGNPVHEDLDCAARLAPPHWVATVVDQPPDDPDPASPRPFPVRVIQGSYPAALDEAGARHDHAHRIPFTCAPSLLLVDAGGEPRDATFLQAHKSLQHAIRFIASGGRILLVAECADGLGSATLSRYASDPEGFRPLRGLSGDPLGGIHLQTVVALRHAAGMARVGLWSGLPDSTVRGLGLEPLHREEEALEWCREAMAAGTHPPPSWGWLPRAERFLPAPGWLGGGAFE